MGITGTGGTRHIISYQTKQGVKPHILLGTLFFSPICPEIRINIRKLLKDIGQKVQNVEQNKKHVCCENYKTYLIGKYEVSKWVSSLNFCFIRSDRISIHPLNLLSVCLSVYIYI